MRALIILCLLLLPAFAVAQTQVSPPALATLNGGIVAVIGADGRFAFARLDTSLELVTVNGALVLRAVAQAAPTFKTEVTKSTADGTTLTITGTPKPGTLLVFANGILLSEGDDYTIAGQVITFVDAHRPRLGSIHQIRYQE